MFFGPRTRRILFLLSVLLPASLASPAVGAAQAAAPLFVVKRAGARAKAFTAADLGRMPRVTWESVSKGITTVYEGVAVHEVLKAAGAPVGSGMGHAGKNEPGLRESPLAGYVVAEASDGYRVVFSSGELDPDLSDGQYLLADRANGKPLISQSGAFRLVVPKDKRGARSVRMLASLTVVQLPK